MSHLIELWSLPWHALQRSLVKDFRAETAVSTADASATSQSSARVAGAPAGSWLMRARHVELRFAIPQGNR